MCIIGIDTKGDNCVIILHSYCSFIPSPILYRTCEKVFMTLKHNVTCIHSNLATTKK